LKRATAGLALGSETFSDWVKEQLNGRPLNEDEPSLLRLRRQGLVPVEQIEQVVEAEFGDPKRKGRARRILAALLVLRSGMRPSDVARKLGVTRSAVSRSVIREGEKSPFDAETTRRVREVAALLQPRLEDQA